VVGLGAGPGMSGPGAKLRWARKARTRGRILDGGDDAQPVATAGPRQCGTTSSPTHTCCDTLPGTSWRPTAKTRERSSTTSGTGTSSTRSGTRNYRRSGSRGSGGTRVPASSDHRGFDQGTAGTSDLANPPLSPTARATVGRVGRAAHELARAKRQRKGKVHAPRPPGGRRWTPRPNGGKCPPSLSASNSFENPQKDYNFGRLHKTLRLPPAMETWKADHVWSLEEIASLAGKFSLQCVTYVLEEYSHRTSTVT
jgi:hypothetical protein